METKYRIDGIELDGTPVQIYDDFLREDPVITKTQVDIDVTKPSMSITSHTANQEIKDAKVGMILDVKGTVEDNSGGSGLKSVVVTLREQNSSIGQPYMPATITVTPATHSNWAVKLTVENLKYNRIVAKATDNAGNYRTGNVQLVYKPTVS